MSSGMACAEVANRVGCDSAGTLRSRSEAAGSTGSGFLATPSASIPMVAATSLISARFGSPVPVTGWDSRSEEHTSELQSRGHLVCRLLLEKKKLDMHHTASMTY